MERFFWLIEGELAGASCPGERSGPGRNGAAPAPGNSTVSEDLTWLRDRGIGALLTLTEWPLPAGPAAASSLEILHLPVPDLTPPTPEGLMHALHFIDLQRSSGRAVAIHCLMGQGRTGTVLAAYLIRSGLSAEDAIGRLRQICPGAVAAPEQEAALRAFALRRDWVL